MPFETISLETDDRGVTTMTLDRADKHNAMSALMISEIIQATDNLSQRQDVRGLVITGAGRSFCAGADLGWMKDNFGKEREERIAESETLGRMLEGLDQLPMPVIAKVNGQAFAGGIGLIAVCDIAIGVSDALFSITEVRLGLLPANISPYLIRRMGIKNVRRSCLTAHFFKGAEAVTLGLLDKAVDMPSLDAAVESEIKELLQCAPGAVAQTKKLIQDVSTQLPQDTRDYRSALLADCWEGDEAQDGIKCFFNKSLPSWRR